VDPHKQHAVDLHTRQAGEFEQRYRALAESPYASTFTYGRKKIEELLERELEGLPPGTRALDAGCGTGFNVQRLAARGFAVTGLEPAEGMRALARANNPGLPIVDGDIEALPFADEAFDVVVCIEVIRYLENPAKALRELCRVLRPAGTAVITAAPLLSLNGYSMVNAVTSRVRVPTFTKVKHSFLTQSRARALARGAGFSSVQVHGAFLGPWHALGRLSPRLLAATLQACEPVDDALADRPILRDLSNHLIIVARR